MNDDGGATLLNLNEIAERAKASMAATKISRVAKILKRNKPLCLDLPPERVQTILLDRDLQEHLAREMQLPGGLDPQKLQIDLKSKRKKLDAELVSGNYRESKVPHDMYN